jgi:cell division cycle protein 20 (cofactor of APC complex)
VTDSLAKQAGGGIIRKGGAESRIDVITRDYVPPPKTEMKRSRSTPANRSVDLPLCVIRYRGTDV